MSGPGADYYSVDAILAEETTVPARLVHGCTGGWVCAWACVCCVGVVEGFGL